MPGGNGWRGDNRRLDGIKVYSEPNPALTPGLVHALVAGEALQWFTIRLRPLN